MKFISIFVVLAFVSKLAFGLNDAPKEQDVATPVDEIEHRGLEHMDEEPEMWTEEGNYEDELLDEDVEHRDLGGYNNYGYGSRSYGSYGGGSRSYGSHGGYGGGRSYSYSPPRYSYNSRPVRSSTVYYATSGKGKGKGGMSMGMSGGGYYRTVRTSRGRYYSGGHY